MIRFYALFGAIIGQGVLRARQDGKIQQHFNRYWWTTNDPEERKAAKRNMEKLDLSMTEGLRRGDSNFWVRI